MKHILLATTALVATAGVASAEIALSGSADMGIIGGEHTETQFHTDIDVTFAMTGESDNGLTFGASIDLDESDGSDGDCEVDGTEVTCSTTGASKAFGNTGQGGETIFIAYGPAKLTMGDTDGAYAAALQDAIIGSAINDDHEHAGYNGNDGLDGAYDGQIATFSYAASGFTGYLSAEINDSKDADNSPIWGVGVAYTADLGGTALNIGLGYQSGDTDAAKGSASGIDLTDVDSVADLVGAVSSKLRTDAVGLSLGTTFNNGIQAIFNYSQANYVEVVDAVDANGDALDTGNTESHWGLAFGYSMNALTVGVNYGEYENFLGIDGAKVSGWGLAADYDLGGGLSAQFGYGDSKRDYDGVDADDSTWSLGLAMTF